MINQVTYLWLPGWLYDLVRMAKDPLIVQFRWTLCHLARSCMLLTTTLNLAKYDPTWNVQSLQMATTDLLASKFRSTLDYKQTGWYHVSICCDRFILNEGISNIIIVHHKPNKNMKYCLVMNMWYQKKRKFASTHYIQIVAKHWHGPSRSNHHRN